MKHILVIVCILFAGCTVLDKSTYFSVVNYKSASFDEMDGAYTYVVEENEDIIVYCGAISHKSVSIGFILPIIPQIDRDSRLAYDIKRSRNIQIQNKGTGKCLLSGLQGILKTEGQYSDSGEFFEEITILPNESVWLILPEGEDHSIGIGVGEDSFKLKIREVSKHSINAVSV